MHSASRSFRAALSLAAALSLGCGGDGSPTGPPSMTLTVTSLALTEGTPKLVALSLDRAPDGPVTITLTSQGPALATPTVLTFTPADFATPQTVTVTPVEDIDLVAGADTVVFTAAGLETALLPVTIADDDIQEIVIDQDSVSITEGQGTAVGVRLRFQPAANVTVTVTSQNTFAVTANPPQLVFTPTNFAVPQLVGINGKQDANTFDELTGVTIRAPQLPAKDVIVVVIDDDGP